MKNQNGQVVLILILVMTVALAIGLSVIQRSLSDISTSTKVEESSRAFSAAEAGIEKAIQSDAAITVPGGINLGNNSLIAGVQKNDVPQPKQALEYLPIAKEELAQVWLADPQILAEVYDQSSIDVYWGLPNITTDKPALEVTIICLKSGSYQSKKFFLDSDSSRISSNNFQDASAGCTNPAIDTSLGSNRTFFCKTTLTGLERTLMLLRARILYSSASQPFAVQPLNNKSLPVQARLFTSTGISGATQRKVQVFRLDKVVPLYFDYAIFSVGPINK